MVFIQYNCIYVCVCYTTTTVAATENNVPNNCVPFSTRAHTNPRRVNDSTHFRHALRMTQQPPFRFCNPYDVYYTIFFCCFCFYLYTHVSAYKRIYIHKTLAREFFTPTDERPFFYVHPTLPSRRRATSFRPGSDKRHSFNNTYIYIYTYMRTSATDIKAQTFFFFLYVRFIRVRVYRVCARSSHHRRAWAFRCDHFVPFVQDSAITPGRAGGLFAKEYGRSCPESPRSSNEHLRPTARDGRVERNLF